MIAHYSHFYVPLAVVVVNQRSNIFTSEGNPANPFVDDPKAGVKAELGATLNAGCDALCGLDAGVGVEAVVDGVDDSNDAFLARRLDTNAGSDPPAHVTVNASRSLSPFSDAVIVVN